MESWKTLVVGYQSFGTGEFQTTAGAAFSPINATGKWVNETNLFGQTIVGGDTAMMFNYSVWNLDTWAFNGYDGTGKSLGWEYFYTDSTTWEEGQVNVASFETQQGDTIVFQPNDTVSGITISGQVADTAKSATWTMPAGESYAKIMNPYPIDTTLSDLETFAVPGDTLYVFNRAFWDLDFYVYLGKGNGWSVTTYNAETWTQYDYTETDTTKVVMPAGIGGTYQSADQDGRTWTVTLGK